MKPEPIYLKDYRAPDFLVESIDLRFELGEEITQVHAKIQFCRNSNQGRHQRPLVLQGEALKLISLRYDNKSLAPHEYTLSPTELRIDKVGELFTLEIVTEIAPQKNTALSGLYRSGKLFCTQCEAQGFRRITYYLDRPDVMAPFTTTIVADKTRYPVMLSNGNLIEKGELKDNLHWVKWEDPFKKPSYLFALVAGDLAKISDSYVTQSGRKVALEIFVEAQNKDKCAHALRALKSAMRWDEKTYGREYDLDIYMIVAVNDFNMGAMENKGLNIFNSKYVLVSEDTATDQDFQNVEAVIGHEYFHNWTGNRITCRDWFQLSLKEGLTVFREQQFCADQGSPTLERIKDARLMRTRQFAEEAGPMAHPVRPASYIEINNFYTATVYNKGSEVIRMLHTLLGEAKFKKGMDLYFERHDHQAVTIEDFVSAFADANDVDLQAFQRWYHQAGTPTVEALGTYEAASKQFILMLKQTTPVTPADLAPKKPFVIPIKIALYGDQGEKLSLKTQSPLTQTESGTYFVLDKSEEKIIFEGINAKPIPSLLGNFSAPVKLSYAYTQAELAVLISADEDKFNQWDAAQRMSGDVIHALMEAHKKNQTMSVPGTWIEAYRHLLKHPITDPGFLAEMLVIPSFNYLAQGLEVIEVDSLKAAREALLKAYATDLEPELATLYQLAKKSDDGSLSAMSRGYRSLKNVCLYYLVRTLKPQAVMLAKTQYDEGRNMTDIMGALGAMSQSADPIRDKLFEDFYAKWKTDPLVVNKWLSLQACSELPQVLEKIKQLTSHEAFDLRNPNKVYALIYAFGMSNPESFHDSKGEGYDFIADQVLKLNQSNPQVAARLMESLTGWKRLDPLHGNLMKAALLKIQAQGSLCEDVYEIVTKSLKT